MEANVKQFTKAEKDLSLVTTLISPLGRDMSNLQKSFGSLSEYVHTLQNVDHEAVIVVCNGGEPSPGRLKPGLEDFVASCPFPKVYDKYRWVILEQSGKASLAELASSDSVPTGARSDLKLSTNSSSVTIDLAALSKELHDSKKYLNSSNARVLVLIVSQSTPFSDFIPRPDVRLHILLCINKKSDADKITMMQWMELCRKHGGTFDYVELPSSASATPTQSSASPPASAVAAAAVPPATPTSPPNTQSQASPTDAVPQSTPSVAQQNLAKQPPTVAQSGTGVPASGSGSSSQIDPRSYVLQFLTRVCQPLPTTRSNSGANE